MSFEERLEGLSEGRYEVIACGLLATSELKDSLLLTSPITLNKQVLVQRKESGENGETTLSISVTSWTWPGGHFTS